MSRDRIGYDDYVRTDLNNFGNVMQDILGNVTNIVRYARSEGTKATAKKAAKLTRESGTYTDHNDGKYRKSITMRSKDTEFYTEAQIYARQAGLTHLLENGHQLWNAPGRKTRAFVHWKLGEALADKILVEEILKKLK